MTGNFTGICDGVLLVVQSYKPRKATGEDMVDFHSEEYINFLQSVTPQNKVRPGRTPMHPFGYCMQIRVCHISQVEHAVGDSTIPMLWLGTCWTPKHVHNDLASSCIAAEP